MFSMGGETTNNHSNKRRILSQVAKVSFHISLSFLYVEGSGPMFAFSGMWDSHVNCSCAQSTKVYHMNVNLTLWTKRHYMNWLRIFHFLNHISVFTLDGYVVLLNINKILQKWIPGVTLVYQIVIESITIYM